MTSIYKIGTEVVCPEGAKYGEKVKNTVGSIEDYKRGTTWYPLVKWNDGQTGYMKVNMLITLEKYNQFREAGYSDAEIAEYVKMYNGHIYN